MDIQAILCISRIISRDLEVNSRVKPSTIMRGLEQVTP